MITNLLLLCGAVGGPLFVIAFLIQGATRAGYDSMREPVSALALGPSGWMQQLNFLVTGGLMLAFAVGVWFALRLIGGSIWGPALIGLYAIGLIGAGVFITDPFASPTGGAAPTKATAHSLLHDLFSMVTFVALTAACAVLAHFFVVVGSLGWAIYSAMTGGLFAVGFVLFARGFSQAGALAPVAGLLQRITIIIGWGWLTMLAIHLLRM